MRRPVSPLASASPASSSAPGEGSQEEYEEFEDTADVLLTAFGALSRWSMPPIPGLEDFAGELHHSAGFDPGEGRVWEEAAERWRGKRVGVVGVVSLCPSSFLSLPSSRILR